MPPSWGHLPDRAIARDLDRSVLASASWAAGSPLTVALAARPPMAGELVAGTGMLCRLVAAEVEPGQLDGRAGEKEPSW